MVQVNYGLLLTKWGEKRIQQGEEMIKDANIVIDNLDKKYRNLSILSPFILFNP